MKETWRFDGFTKKMSSLSKDKKINLIRGNIYIYLIVIWATNHVNFLSFDNDMKPSKRQVSFVSLIFVLKCS